MLDALTVEKHGAETPVSIREDFPILSGTGAAAGAVYLDNAATTHKPTPVLDAIVDYYTTANSNVGRGYHRLAFAATDRFDQARRTVASAIGAGSPDEVVFTGGTTDGVNLVAATAGAELVGPGDQVLITGMEHNSNLLPWRRLCEERGAELVVVPVGPDGATSLEAFDAALGDRVRIAAISHVSNVLGTVNPVREMTALARRRGAVVVVDGAQAVAHRPVDVAGIGADFYCFSAHKMYGPQGVGVLHGRSERLADLPPYRVGGGTVKGVRFDEPVSYVPTPARLEAGTPDVAGAVGLAAAFDYLRRLGFEQVRRHDAELVRYAVSALGEIGGVRVVGAPERDPSGIVSFVVDGIHPYDVGGYLDQHGIAVRCGVHCASTFLDALGLLGTVRLSFGVYNTTEEVDEVCRALRSVRPGTWTAEHPNARFL
ncbi:aminotransferase class V-fold PLP-dependent enzyme [Saccharopolyspora sp. CA-218241]|uniref:aminotransferase class V-fold PLP-dependent enzyme n=1 Tax=Saccharopolyspora sp. CA-218241 TaxID=3240027 RepID=UPI003D99C68A